jgi:branched-subunit amino acid aminotransferase/4-amino-4-deoxychorismate lyase
MSDSETIFIKTKFNQPWYSQKSIAIPNRAMAFGDGLFETMTALEGEVRFFDLHHLRLTRGMRLLKLDPELIDISELKELIKRYAIESNTKIRWTIFRAGMGKYTPESTAVIQMIQISKFNKAPLIKAQTGFSEIISLSRQPWSRFKTLNSLPYVLANQERSDRGWDEIILCTPEGLISEAGASNIFWIKENRFFTPSLDCNCLEGVSRAIIIDSLRKNNYTLSEGLYQKVDLMSADQIFVSNSSGISMLAKVENKEFSIAPLDFITDQFIEIKNSK